MKAIKESAQQHLVAQRKYVQDRHLENQRAAAKAGGTSGLVDERMLAETMRAVRYADEGHASGDIIDNAIEAGASQVHVIFRTEGTAIKEIAFIDDASGIDESFLPHATKWGGSSNDGKRNTFGRFGVGMPSASVNRGRKFSVHSRIDEGSTYASVTVDLDNLGLKDQAVQLPVVTKGPLPRWVEDYVESVREDKSPVVAGGPEAVRTVVIWSNLDRLAWPNKQQAAAKFKEHLGITYAGWVDVCKIFVAGEAVEPVDVLFTTPGYRYFDIPGSPGADSHSPIRFEAEDADGNSHTVTVRFSMLTVPAYKAAVATGGRGRPAYVRQRIRTDYNGFFVTRNGRFIELVKSKILTWNNYARQVAVSIDFPPELDELFGVTPDKQTIIFSAALEKMLEAQGVVRSFKSLYAEVEAERRRLKIERDAAKSASGERPSEAAIAKTVEMDVRRTRKASKEKQEEAQRNFRERVKKLAEESGVPEEQVAEAQEKVQRAKPYRVEFSKQASDDPFYTPFMDGVQLVLRINTAHAWYMELYSKLEESQAEIRSGLELMLWVLATCEIDAPGDVLPFYRDERREWSRRLSNAFALHPLVFNDAATRAELDDEDPAPWAEDEDDAPGQGDAEAS